MNPERKCKKPSCKHMAKRMRLFCKKHTPKFMAKFYTKQIVQNVYSQHSLVARLARKRDSE